MSISKTFDPFTYFPANHPIIFRVSGTNSAEAQYRFIFRLEVGAESQKHKVTPRPTDANGRWDGSAHFRSFLDQDVVNIASVSDFQEAPLLKKTHLFEKTSISTSGLYIHRDKR